MIKNSLLLLLTPNNSLEKWNARGQLSRELSFYEDLCTSGNLKLIIFSFGRNDRRFLRDYPHFELLQMFPWIPRNIPFRLQNLIYYVAALVLYRKYFRRVLISKTNQFRSARFGLLLKWFYGIPLVVRMGFYHSHFKQLSRTDRLEEKVTFRTADRILTTSFEAGSFIEKTYGIRRDKILCMCNAIDLKVFRPADVPREYDVAFVGRLEKLKNIQLMIDAFSGTELRFLIIGDGSLRPVVKAAAGASPNIIWKDRVDNVELPQYLNRSRSFILLSTHEGNPKALLEAMACGLPSIVSRVPGIRECIQEDVSGWFTEMDAEEIRTKVRRLVQNEEKAAEMGQHACRWVREQSDFRINIRKEIAFYQPFLNPGEPVGLDAAGLKPQAKASA
ncbi:MAG TPA: glycosyltransferase family 4 protein [Sphingobacteriaceae bacterium]